MEEKFNQTLEKFGYPDTLIAEYDHWVLLLRPRQVTLGACVIAAKSGVTSIADLPPAAGTEFFDVIHDFERALKGMFNPSKFNYIALMMVDPNPHFHAIPRYDAAVEYNGDKYEDTLYPKPPDLGVLIDLSDRNRALLLNDLKQSIGRQK